MNMYFSFIQWVQATLPIRYGGLGIHRESSLASSDLPFASAASIHGLQSFILLKAELAIDPHEAAIITK